MIPIVLVHGLIGTLREPRLLAAIGNKARAIHQLGYGENANTPAEKITLEHQVEYLHEWLEKNSIRACHLVGHSVGGVVATMFAHKYPDRVLSFINVEGNFSLKDAFMTNKIAQMTASEAEEMLNEFRANPSGWLESKSVPATAANLEIVNLWFNDQPGSTIQAQSASVIDVTSKPAYTQLLKEVFAHTRPTHLIAGERSRNGWDVPDWAIREAKTFTIMPEVGHFMTLEQPEAFGQLLLQLVEQSP
jgi:lipase